MNRQDKANFLLLAQKACDAKDYSFFHANDINDVWVYCGWQISYDYDGVSVWGENAEGVSDTELIVFKPNEVFPDPKWNEDEFGNFWTTFGALKFIAGGEDTYSLSIINNDLGQEVSLPAGNIESAKYLTKLIIERIRKEERTKLFFPF